jgi:hypothetical protein
LDPNSPIKIYTHFHVSDPSLESQISIQAGLDPMDGFYKVRINTPTKRYFYDKFCVVVSSKVVFPPSSSGFLLEKYAVSTPSVSIRADFGSIKNHVVRDVVDFRSRSGSISISNLHMGDKGQLRTEATSGSVRVKNVKSFEAIGAVQSGSVHLADVETILLRYRGMSGSVHVNVSLISLSFLEPS